MASRKIYLDQNGRKSYEKGYLVNDHGNVVLSSVGVRYIQDLTDPEKNTHQKSQHQQFELFLVFKTILFGILGIIAAVGWLITQKNQIPVLVASFCLITELASSTLYAFLKSKKYKFPSQRIIFRHFGVLLHPLRYAAALFWILNVFVIVEGDMVLFLVTSIALVFTPLGAGQRLSKM